MSTYKIFDIARNLPAESTLLSYKGSFDTDAMDRMSLHVREIGEKYPNISKKLYIIFNELTENISYYSSERHQIDDEGKHGIGNLHLFEFEEQMVFIAANRVNKKRLAVLQERCKYINSLDRENLRELKRKFRKLPPGIKDGANIGLIQIALTSKNPLKYTFEEINDDFAFFKISVAIDKISD